MQQKAIMHESGPVMCLAGPGSGKTFVLTYHIKYLIEELNVEPSKILVITFSKAAAKEMQQRFVSIMGNQILPVKFGTFHAIFFHMLCQHQGYSANSIISLREKKKYLNQQEEMRLLRMENEYYKKMIELLTEENSKKKAQAINKKPK